jgi:hypothetical protein
MFKQKDDLNKVTDKSIKFCDSMKFYSQLARTFHGDMRQDFLAYLSHAKTCEKCVLFFKVNYNQTPEEYKCSMILEWSKIDRDEIK